MATAHMVLKGLDRLFGEGTLAGRSDAALLARFLARRDEAAFAALVARHGPMVLRTCRAVLRDANDAEDAFQATFLVLVRKAGSIRGREALGGWLHRVAYRAAVQANRAAARRAREEREAAARRLSSRDPAREDRNSTLHAEIDRLPDALRQAVVLCDLQGLSREQAADELHWSQGTLRGRLARGRARLRSRLTGAGALAGLAVVPEAWAETAVRNALACLSGRTAGSAAVLATRVIRMTNLARIQSAGLAALALLTLGTAIVAVGAPGEAPSPTPQPAAVAVPVAPDDGDELLVYSGRVLDPSGKPVVGAKLFLVSSDDPTPPRATSDSDGRYRFSVPVSSFEDRIWARHARVAAAVAGFGLGLTDSEHPDAGREATLRLVEDLPISGLVVDLEGRPAVGATVRVSSVWSAPGGDLSPWIKASRAEEGDHYALKYKYLSRRFPSTDKAPGLVPSVTTDAEGKFRLAGVGRERLAELTIEGPTICLTEVEVLTRPGESFRTPDIPGATNAGGYATTYHGASPRLAAAPNRPIEGVVRDRQTGRPIAGARVGISRPFSWASRDTLSDAQGRFRITSLPRGSGKELRILAPEGEPYLPAMVAVENPPGLGPVACDIALTRGIAIRGRITDAKTGEPVWSCVSYHADAKNPALEAMPEFRAIRDYNYKFRRFTRPDGTYTVVALPGKGLINVEVLSHDYPDLRDGLPDRGDYVPQFPGYAHALVKIDLPESAGPQTRDVTVTPGRTIIGTIVGPDDRPLDGVYIHGLDPNGGWTSQPLNGPEFKALAFRPSSSPRTLLFQHESGKLAGWREVRGDETGPIRVRLEPSAAFVGRLLGKEGKPLADATLATIVADRENEDRWIRHRPEATRTDADGRFRVEGLAAGLRYKIAPALRRREGLKIEPLKSGEVRDLGSITFEQTNDQKSN
jgi:RNA polymerase sigma factor (sigma-70 family)